MTLSNAVDAYRALTQMMKETWDFDFIYPLLKLRQELATDYELFCHEEIRLVTVYGKKNGEGKVEIAADGSFDFENYQQAEGYRRDHLELANREIPAKPKIKVAPPGVIRGEWAAALAPYCEFEKSEENHDETS